MTKESSNHNSSPWFLRAAEFFLEKENVGKKYEGIWGYPQIEKLLREIAINLDPSFEKESFEKIINFLKEYFAEKTVLESKIPPNLKQLAEEYEEAEQKAAIFRKKAADKLEAFLEFKEKQNKNSALFRKFAEVYRQKLSQSPIPEQQTPTIAESLVRNMEIDSSLALTIKKAEFLPTEKEKMAALKEITRDWQNLWQKTVEKTAEEFKEQGIKLTPEQISYLETRPIPFPISPPTPEQIQTLISPPLTAQQAEFLIEEIRPSLAKNFPEIKLTPEEFSKLSPEKKQEVLREVKTQIEEAIVLSLGENYQSLAEKITLSPESLPLIVETFLPRTEKELVDFLPLISAPPETRIPPNNLPLVTEELVSFPTKGPFFFASTRKQALTAKPEDLETEGVKFVEGLKERLWRTGINRSHIPLFAAKFAEHQAFILTLYGISKEDLENTINKLIEKGVEPGSLAIQELKAAKENLANFQETTQIPREQVLSWREQRVSEKEKGKVPSITLPFSRLEVLISEKATFNPKLNLSTKINSFFRHLFGEKVVFLKQQQAIIVSKFSLFRQKFFLGIKNWFFKTGLGKTVKAGLEKAALKSLQAFWIAAKTGAKRVIQKGLTAIVAKLGLQGALQIIGSAVPGLGNAVALVVGFILGKVGSLLKRGIGFLTSGLGFFDGILSGITGISYTKKDDKSFSWVLGGAFVVLGIVMFLSVLTFGGAFMGTGKGAAIPGGYEVNPNCQLPKLHLSEETICKLTWGNSPCNNHFITQETWDKVSQCFHLIDLPGKLLIQSHFQNSVEESGNLQCGSFAMGIQAALGKPLNPVEFAKDWLVNYPPAYDLITTGKPNPTEGDLFVWKGNIDGHIAVFLKKDGEEKIIVAEANGFTGKLALVKYPYRALGVGEGSPDGLLHLK